MEVRSSLSKRLMASSRDFDRAADTLWVMSLFRSMERPRSWGSQPVSEEGATAWGRGVIIVQVWYGKAPGRGAASAGSRSGWRPARECWPLGSCSQLSNVCRAEDWGRQRRVTLTTVYNEWPTVLKPFFLLETSTLINSNLYFWLNFGLFFLLFLDCPSVSTHYLFSFIYSLLLQI